MRKLHGVAGAGITKLLDLGYLLIFCLVTPGCTRSHGEDKNKRANLELHWGVNESTSNEARGSQGLSPTLFGLGAKSGKFLKDPLYEVAKIVFSKTREA